MACSTCNTPNCGCTGTYTVSATCPPACSEVFNMQCIVYTGVDLTCDGDVVISRNDYLDSAITKLVDYVCSKVAPPASVVAGSAFIDVVPTTDPVTSVTTYTVSADMAAFEIWVAPIITNQILAKVLAGPGIDVAPDAVAGTVTVSHEDTSSVTDLSSNNTGNSFIQSINFTFDTFGHVTGASAVPGTVVHANAYAQFDITDTDPGTYTWSSVGSAIATSSLDTFTVLSGEGIDVDVDVTALAMRIAFTGIEIDATTGLDGDGTIAAPLKNVKNVWTRFTDDAGTAVTADTTTDNLNVVGAGGITTTIDPATDTLEITNTSPATDVTLATVGSGNDLVNDGVGPALAVKSIVQGSGTTMLSSATELSIAADVAKFNGPATIPAPGAGGTIAVAHGLSKLNVMVTVRDATAGGNAYYAGVDYTVTFNDNDNLTITDIGGNLSTDVTYSVMG
tara:strand:+ start:7527 stop:8876 length:1350 start_codon:yes stop_codon:yes gene_type:complete